MLSKIVAGLVVAGAELRHLLVGDPEDVVGGEAAVVEPLPDLGAGDLGGRRVLHQVVDRDGADAPQPGREVLDPDARRCCAGPSSVTSPGVAAHVEEIGRASTATSSRCRSIWFGRSPRTASNASSAIGTRSGCATHVPSKPVATPRAPCPRAPSRARRAFTSASRRLGMNAAMPPIASAPRRWQVFTSSSRVGAHERHGHRDLRRGRAARTRAGARNFLITLKM